MAFCTAAVAAPRHSFAVVQWRAPLGTRRQFCMALTSTSPHHSSQVQSRRSCLSTSARLHASPSVDAPVQDEAHFNSLLKKYRIDSESGKPGTDEGNGTKGQQSARDARSRKSKRTMNMLKRMEVSKLEKLEKKQRRAQVKAQKLKSVMEQIASSEDSAPPLNRGDESDAGTKGDDSSKPTASTLSYMKSLLQRASSEGGERQARHQWGPNAEFRDLRPKDYKAALNAQVIEEARLRQQQLSRDARQDPSTRLMMVPGSGSNIAPHALNYYLNFQATEIKYPPGDVYPPSLPRLADEDMIYAARAFGIQRFADVEWVPNTPDKPGHWRRITRSPNYYEGRGMYEYLEGEQQFEYIGDSVLHLISRSLLMSRFPRRAPFAYNLGANFLVSNDVFGHMYDDVKLEEERERVFYLLLNSKISEDIESAISRGLSEAEVQERRNAPLPRYDLPLTHQRKADLFEAYTGALYLSLGFTRVSRWATQVFEPWVDRIARTPGFQSQHTLTAAGIAERRATKRSRDEEEKRRAQEYLANLSPAQRAMRSVFSFILPKRLFPELRSEQQEESEEYDSSERAAR